MKIVTLKQMRRIEEKCASEGTSTDELMENAGLEVAKEARRALRSVAGVRVLVLVGPGNNGGDGLVAARHLRLWGAEVTAYLMLRALETDPKLRLAEEAGVVIRASLDGSCKEALDSELARARLVIDAVLGTGRARPLEGPIAEVMLRLGRAQSRRAGQMLVLALDLPTGMDADTGQVDQASPPADVTVALGYPKRGHFEFPAAANLGVLRVANIGIPEHLAEDIVIELLTDEWVRERLPERPLSGHKGTFGHTLIVAGSTHYVGAAYLASQGAARVGAGLVTLASPKGVYPNLASKLGKGEVIHLPLPEDDDGRFHPEAADLVKEQLRHYTSMVVGCGFGRSARLASFIKRLLLEETKPPVPVVIDADGLNNLSTIDGWWRDLTSPAVLTPHPGEMSTLSGVTTMDVQARRIDTVVEWSARWGQVLTLKGAFTAIAGPEGWCKVSPFANPGLASGGTGDVLSGVIGGLLAQGLSPEDAACCGVYLHGAAGEVIRQQMGDTGTLAGDLLKALPGAIKTIRNGTVR